MANTELQARLMPDEDEATLDCGCVLKNTDEGFEWWACEWHRRPKAPTKVVIVMEGGVIQDVRGENFEVEVRDYDVVQEYDPNPSVDENGDLYHKTLWTSTEG